MSAISIPLNATEHTRKVNVPAVPGADLREEEDHLGVGGRRADEDEEAKGAGHRPCWCGCGDRTNKKKAKFVPGHDAKLKSKAGKAARGEVDTEEVLSSLPHDEARSWYLVRLDEALAREVAGEATDKPAALSRVSEKEVQLPAAPKISRTSSKRMCFDAYVMVDWGSRSGLYGVSPDANAPWLAEAWWNGANLQWSSEAHFRTRRLCIEHVLHRLQFHVERRHRILVCFDFAYGYPAGYAAALGLSGPHFWRSIWNEISAPSPLDGMAHGPAPTNQHATGNNRNNRFAVASYLNARVMHLADFAEPGPLYGCPRQNETAYFTSAAPQFPWRVAGGTPLQEFRITEQRLRDLPGDNPLSCWWVLGGGAPTVGGQILPEFRR